MRRALAPVLALLLMSGTARGDVEAARALFHRGELPNGAKTQPCAGCHAADGGGRTEGGVAAPSIQFEALADLTGGVAYGGASLATLLAEGRTPDGRVIDRVMPRLKLPAQLAEDVLALLRTLRAEDSPGVEAERIRIGAFLSRSADPFPAAFAAAVTRWSGGGRIYGRRIEVEALDETAFQRERADLFAMVGLTAAQRRQAQDFARAGGLNLFPRYPFDGGEDADANRGILPDFGAIERALAAAAKECARVEIGGGDAQDGARLREAILRARTATPETGEKCRVALIDDPGMALADDERLIAPLDSFAARLSELATRRAGVTLIDIRPAGAPGAAASPPGRDVERFAAAAAFTLVEGLTHVGRGLTRARLMQALDALAVSPPDWQPLDYRIQRLSGGAAAGTVRLGAAR